ncbi:MAG: hypothetical protein IJ583_07820 [Firmicutes bacterium]|nr:hypothetical protein [Bacillota bacterium]
MSAYLMVFNKEKAPTEPIEFLKWYYGKADWDSERLYGGNYEIRKRKAGSY